MNWQFHNSWGLNSATRAYGINESVGEQNGAIFSFAEKHQLNLPFTNFFEAKTEIRKPFFERTKGKYLFKELEAGNYGQLIVTRFELLGKTPLQMKDTIGKFTARGVVLHILDLAGMEFSIGSEVGKMIEYLIDWAAAVEGKYVRKDLEHTESIQEALIQKREAGFLTGTVPFGWDAIETGEVTPKGVKLRKLVDNPEQQRWILQMAKWRNSGWSDYKIAQELNRLNVPTKLSGMKLKLRAQRNADDESSIERTAAGKWQLQQVSKTLSSVKTQELLAKNLE